MILPYNNNYVDSKESVGDVSMGGLEASLDIIFDRVNVFFNNVVEFPVVVIKEQSYELCDVMNLSYRPSGIAGLRILKGQLGGSNLRIEISKKEAKIYQVRWVVDNGNSDSKQLFDVKYDFGKAADPKCSMPTRITQEGILFKNGCLIPSDGLEPFLSMMLCEFGDGMLLHRQEYASMIGSEPEIL